MGGGGSTLMVVMELIARVSGNCSPAGSYKDAAEVICFHSNRRSRNHLLLRVCHS